MYWHQVSTAVKLNVLTAGEHCSKAQCADLVSNGMRLNVLTAGEHCCEAQSANVW